MKDIINQLLKEHQAELLRGGKRKDQIEYRIKINGSYIYIRINITYI